MKTLIVTAHPDSDSLTQRLARQLAEALQPAVTEIADLAAEGFDPRFTRSDRHTYRTGTDTTAAVAAEQRRIDTAQHVVLVFPVYWWSMPALLKGWIDRVFVNGWAFDIHPSAGILRNLTRLTMHLVAIAGDDADLYRRHGYSQALRTQIEHGIVDYCGMTRGVTAFLHSSEREDAARRHRDVDNTVAAVRRAILETDIELRGAGTATEMSEGWQDRLDAR